MSSDEFDDLLDNEEDEDLIRTVNSIQAEQALLERSLPPLLNDSLLPFQRDGVLFGIRKNGCCLIGDEMGLGKTIQAIAISSYYASEWPLLVVVPSSMKYVWLEEVQKWLPHLTPDTIHLVRCAEDVPNLLRSKISIVSYGLFQYKRFFDLLENLKITFKVIICDESHYMKNWKTVRTKHLVKLLHHAKRRILLTGTPALGRPEELYTQISAVAPGLFGKYSEFCQRFCQGHYNYRLKRWDVSGASNLPQLHSLLTKHVMIRRLKANVLRELPAKQRQKISFDLSPSAMRDIEKTKLKLEELKASEHGGSKVDFEINKAMMELYKLTGLAKIPASVEYVKELVKQDTKFLVFAHHLAMLDAVEQELISSRTDYIRIDGSVPSVQRQEFVRKFQNTESCKVALLGIQAGGVGLTLTAASVVVFCELHWSPGILQQAEDRVHRISQKNAVNIYYLIGLGTMDETLWKKLNRKVDVVSKALQGQGGDMGTAESRDTDIKELLAACTAGPALPISPRKRKKTTATSSTTDPMSCVTYTPGQTKLTSFLNMSVDEDFKDQPSTSNPVSSKTSDKVEKLLEKAQVRRDKLRVSLFNRRVTDIRSSKLSEQDSKSKGKSKPSRTRKAGDDKKLHTSKYFASKNKSTVVQIDSSSDSEDFGCPAAKRSRSKCDNIEVIESDTESLDDVDHVTTSKPLVTSSDPPEINPRSSDFNRKPEVSSVEVDNETDKQLSETESETDSDKQLSESETDSLNVKLNTSADSDLPECSFLEIVPPSSHPLSSSPPDNTLTTPDNTQPSSGHSANDTTEQLAAEKISETEDGDSVSSDQDLFTDASSQESCLKFSVSAHTERVYLYDYADTYLEINFLMSDISDDADSIPHLISDNTDYLHQTKQFCSHWENISKTTKSKLYNKIISNVEEELKYIYDHRVVSATRHSRTKPANNTTKKRTIRVSKREVEVEQCFTAAGDPVCMSCGDVVLQGLATTQTSVKLDRSSNRKLSALPFQGRFCSLECSQSYGVKANAGFVRKILFDLELGVCQICGLDTNRLLRQIKISNLDGRVGILNGTVLKSLSECQKRNIVRNPTEGLLWQADHVIPVCEGGGECEIDNYRTLCTVCHKLETKKLMARLAVRKEVNKNKQLGVVDIRTFLG